MPREFHSFVMPISFTIVCARYPIEEIQYNITAASSGTRSWPSQTEHHEFWPEYGPSQDFSNISSLQDNFSDVASEDMRRPVPDFDEEVDVEEGLGQPIVVMRIFLRSLSKQKLSLMSRSNQRMQII